MFYQTKLSDSLRTLIPLPKADRPCRPVLRGAAARGGRRARLGPGHPRTHRQLPRRRAGASFPKHGSRPGLTAGDTARHGPSGAAANEHRPQLQALPAQPMPSPPPAREPALLALLPPLAPPRPGSGPAQAGAALPPAPGAAAPPPSLSPSQGRPTGASLPGRPFWAVRGWSVRRGGLGPGRGAVTVTGTAAVTVTVTGAVTAAGGTPAPGSIGAPPHGQSRRPGSTEPACPRHVGLRQQPLRRPGPQQPLQGEGAARFPRCRSAPRGSTEGRRTGKGMSKEGGKGPVGAAGRGLCPQRVTEGTGDKQRSATSGLRVSFCSYSNTGRISNALFRWKKRKSLDFFFFVLTLALC